MKIVLFALFIFYVFKWLVNMNVFILCLFSVVWSVMSFCVLMELFLSNFGVFKTFSVNFVATRFVSNGCTFFGWNGEFGVICLFNSVFIVDDFFMFCFLMKIIVILFMLCFWSLLSVFNSAFCVVVGIEFSSIYFFGLSIGVVVCVGCFLLFFLVFFMFVLLLCVVCLFVSYCVCWECVDWWCV